jgi:hypothetical protein
MNPEVNRDRKDRSSDLGLAASCDVPSRSLAGTSQEHSKRTGQFVLYVPPWYIMKDTEERTTAKDIGEVIQDGKARDRRVKFTNHRVGHSESNHAVRAWYTAIGGQVTFLERCEHALGTL